MVNGSSDDQISQWSMIPGVPSRSVNEPYGDRNGTRNTDTVRNADTAKNTNRNLLGSTTFRCICGIEIHRKEGKMFQIVIDENARKTISAMGIVRLNLAITSTAFPLHMRFDDMSEINAASSTR